MRQVDEPEPFKPFGEKAVPEKAEKQEEWKPLPHNPGVEVDSRGRVRTNMPLPKMPKSYP